MKTLLCTAGTSVAAGVPRLADEADHERYRRAIRERVETLRGEAPASFLQKLSAETNSLSQVNLDRSDAVQLLHTETLDGRICAEEAARVIERELCDTVACHEVKGLQVKEAREFRRKGIHNLFSLLDRLHHEAPGEVILNATGGYKSVVPYLTLYGLLKRCPVVYLHETARKLITLPPIPITFDFERLGRVRRAMLELREQEVMPRRAFFQLAPETERELIEPLIEEEGDMVASSGLAALLFKEQDAHTSEVFIHGNARAAFEKSDGRARGQFLGMLQRVSDPLWRQSKIHPVRQSDLTVFKPGRTTERMLAFVEGTRVCVCELAAQHNEYERLIESRRIADYRKADFTPWTLPPEEEAPAPTEEETLERVYRERDEMEAAWKQAEEQREAGKQSAAEQIERLREELARARSRADELVSQVEAAAARAKTLDARSRALEAYARKPWWRRLFSSSPGPTP